MASGASEVQKTAFIKHDNDPAGFRFDPSVYSGSECRPRCRSGQISDNGVVLVTGGGNENVSSCNDSVQVAPEDAIFDPVVMDALANAEDQTFSRFKGVLEQRQAKFDENEPQLKKARMGPTIHLESSTPRSVGGTAVVYECIFDFLESQLRKRRQKRILTLIMGSYRN